MLTIMAGSVLAQLVGFALTPVISRLFSPTDFGLFGSFYAVAAVIGAGVTLEYTQAIMLPRDKGDAMHLFFVSCVATCVVAFLCLLACVIVPNQILKLLHAQHAWIFALLVLATLIAGFNKACQGWSTRVKAFKYVSLSQIIRSLTASGAQIGAGYLKFGPIGLICGGMFADLVATLNLFRVVITDLKHLGVQIQWSRMKQLAKEYRDFPMYSASQNVTNQLSTSVPLLLLIHYYGAAIGGAYAFGARILWTPMSLLVGSLRQVLFQKACETEHAGDSLSLLYVRTTAALFAIGIIPSVIMFIWAPPIFAWVFGARWLTAGIFARSLILWLLFVFCNVPAVLFARLIRIQRTVFFYDLALLTARVSVLAIGGLFLSAVHAVMIFSAIGAAMNLFLIILVGYKVIKREGSVDLSAIGQHLFRGLFTVKASAAPATTAEAIDPLSTEQL